jgi:hypothetical protein
MERIVAREACGVKRKEYKGLWYGCGSISSDWLIRDWWLAKSRENHGNGRFERIKK